MTGTFTCDTRGNMTGRVQGDTWTYTCDQGARLTQVRKNNSPTGAYVYDADGMRVKKTVNGVNKRPAAHRPRKRTCWIHRATVSHVNIPFHDLVCRAPTSRREYRAFL